MSDKPAIKGSEEAVPDGLAEAPVHPGLGIATNLAGEELRLVQRITRNTRYLRFTVIISMIFAVLWSVFLILSLSSNILSINMNNLMESIEELVALGQNLWLFLVCLGWIWLSYRGLTVVVKISEWIEEATVNLLGPSGTHAKKTKRVIVGRIGAMGCIRRILDIYDDNRVVLIALEWGLILALLYYVFVFSGGIVFGVLFQPLSDLNLPVFLGGAALAVIFFGSIALPALGFFTVYLSNTELSSWFKRIDGRDFIIEDVVAATPVEVWMVWRVRPGFWEVVGEVIEFCQNSPQSLGLLVAGCKLSLTEVVGYVELLNSQGWLEEIKNDKLTPKYSTTEAGRGFLQSLIGAWSKTFVRGGMPRRWNIT
ncbi:MAG: hypothetical protein ACTSYO_08655 [Candidatus Ranarchaeia archaeon]